MQARLNKFHLDTVQIALFPRDFQIDEPKLLYDKLIIECDFSEQKSIYFGFPSDAPREIPRFFVTKTLPITENEFSIEFSFEKIFITTKLKKNGSEFEKSDSEVQLAQIQKCINSISNTLTFHRVGYIRQLLEFVNPINAISPHFLPTDHTNMKSFELGFLFNPPTDPKIGTKCNHMVKIRSVQIPPLERSDETTVSKKALQIESDYNTIAEVKVNWNISKVLNFITLVNEIAPETEITKIIS